MEIELFPERIVMHYLLDFSPTRLYLLKQLMNIFWATAKSYIINHNFFYEYVTKPVFTAFFIFSCHSVRFYIFKSS